MAPNALQGSSTTIVLFRNSREFVRELKLSKFIGIMQPSFQEHKLLLAANVRRKHYTHVPFHEYAHYIIRSRLERPAPRWLEEGLAQYFSTLKLLGTGQASVGAVDRRRVLVSFLETKQNKWEDILDFDIIHSDAEDLRVQYDAAWALVHYLVHGIPATNEEHPFDRINALLERANSGENAISAYMSIAQMDEKALDNTLYDYLTVDQPEIRFAFDGAGVSVQENDCLDLVDRYMLLADSLAEFNVDRAHYILARLNRLRPNNYAVLAALSEVTRSDAELSKGYADQAYRLNPDVAETNVTKASALIRLCVELQDSSCNTLLSDAQKLYRRALQIDHLRVDAAFGLGILYLNEGRAGDAKNYLRVAHKHAPWSARVNFHLGETYRQLGDYEKASIYMRIAKHWETDEKRLEGMRDILALVEKELAKEL
ncbi:MAG: DUF1570 domain-containing protein [Gammaproteobacteria bacterium]|nr:DUF1570 domain-containing protein [Gammaproteobacteria bacterium]